MTTMFVTLDPLPVTISPLLAAFTLIVSFYPLVFGLYIFFDSSSYKDYTFLIIVIFSLCLLGLLVTIIPWYTVFIVIGIIIMLFGLISGLLFPDYTDGCGIKLLAILMIIWLIAELLIGYHGN